MATEADAFFKHCVPIIETSLERCGALSICETVQPENLDDLNSNWRSNDDWRTVGDLLMTHFELKATSCGKHQNSWRDFLVSNVKNVKRMLQPDNFDKMSRRIKPFLLADQEVPINNVYWRATNGASSGSNWTMRVRSMSGIPASIRSFQVGERVWVESRTAGGSLNNWQGEILESTLAGDGSYVTLVLEPQNDQSFFDNVENPVTGIVRRGPPVVGQTEKYCSNEPAYLNRVTKDYWPQWTRDTFCNDELTSEFFKYILDKNPLYKKYFYLPQVQEEKQRREAFWNKIWENAMWSRPSSPFQNLGQYSSLPNEEIFLSENEANPFGGGRCWGKKTENVGWMEQWQRCKRIVDLQGAQLDLWSLIDAIYDLARVRFQTGSPATMRFTAFTDKTTAELIDRGFIALQNYRTGDVFRITQEVTGAGKANNPFGFQFQSYNLPGKGMGIVLDVMTHFAFDDYISEWSDLNSADMGRNLWLLDPTNFYLGVVHSETTNNRSGNVQDLAKVNPDFLCVQKVPTQDVSILGVMFTSVVECAQRDLLLRNFSGEVPVFEYSDTRPNYILTLDGPTYY